MQSDNQPFFSVIMPVHNKAPYLGRSIASVLNQTFNSFELVLIDDSSSDGSAKILSGLSDARVRVLHRSQPGPGGYAARNLGIIKARGKWIAFLDADDEWSPEHLEVLRHLAAKPEVLVASSAWLTQCDDGRMERSAFSLAHAHVEMVRLGFRDFLEETAKGRTPMWTGVAAAKKSLFAEIGGFPESCRRGGDVVTWLHLVNKSKGLVCSTRPTAVYHREASSVTKNTPLETEKNCVYWACVRLIALSQSAKEQLLLKRFSNYYIKNGLTKRRVSGSLRFSHCNFHYFRADPRYHLFLRAYSLLPYWAQRHGFRAYQEAKKLFVR